VNSFYIINTAIKPTKWLKKGKGIACGAPLLVHLAAS